MTASSQQFKRITVEVGKTAPAYMAFMAIWQRAGRPHVVIAAPTMANLADQWDRITGTDLDQAMAQEVFICSAKHANETEGKP